MLCVVAAAACQDSEPPKPERLPRKLALPPAEPSAESDAGTPWVKRHIDDLRDRTLKWAPLDAPPQRLVFAGDRLFAMWGTDILVIDVAGKTDIIRHAVGGPHQLISLANGDVLAIGVKDTLRLSLNRKAPQSTNRLVVFPQSLVYGSASDAARLDVLDIVSGQWYGYGPQEKPSLTSLWLPDASLDVPELKDAHCAQLLDGTYACFARDQLWHFPSRGRPKSLGKFGVGLPVWHVLGSARADQLWILRRDGQMEKWWFGPPPKRLSTLQLPWTPFDISLKGDTIAVIRVVQDRARPKEVHLVVLDLHGQTRFEQSLIPDHDDEVNLAERELREAEVIVHGKHPWVAVRTSQGIRVVHAQSGETLIEAR